MAGLETSRLVPLAEHGAGLRADLSVPPQLLRDLADAPILAEWEIDGYVDSHGSTELSGAERHALFLLSHGLDERMTADLLGKSIYTVKYQTKSARYKLKAKNTCHAIALALRSGEIA